MTYSATGLPTGLGINPSTGVIAGGPRNNSTPYTVTVTASDGTDNASQTFTWTVNPNPVSVAHMGTRFNADGAFVPIVPVSATDQSGGTLTYSATGLPPGLSISSSGGTISGMIGSNADANSPYFVSITASDGTYSDTEEFSWVIYQPAFPPRQVSYVVNTLNDTPSANGGTLDRNGQVSLRSAITSANAEARGNFVSITFADGLSGTISVGSDTQAPAQNTPLPNLGNNISILGPSSGGIVVSRNATSPNFRIFNIPNTAAGQTPFSYTISNLTITNGNDTEGGGILVGSGPTLSLQSSVVSYNTASGNGTGGGGGISNHGRLFISSSFIKANSTAAWGGGISNWGQAFIHSTAIYQNAATGTAFAGGIANLTASANLQIDCGTDVESNTAAGSGGGIYKGVTRSPL